MFDFWRVVRPAHCLCCQLMVVVVMEVVEVELAVRRRHTQVDDEVREWADEDVDGAPVALLECRANQRQGQENRHHVHLQIVHRHQYHHNHSTGQFDRAFHAPMKTRKSLLSQNFEF